MNHLFQIFEKLNLNRNNGLFISNENKWDNLFSNRVERLLKNKICPDAFFCIDNKPFILFFENPTDKVKKLKEIWNFNEAPIAIIVENGAVEIFNGFEFLFSEDSLRPFGGEEILNQFSYFELVTGKTFEKYSNAFDYSNRIDFYLLNNIKDARNHLIKHNLSIELANSLLGKIIFVRYLIDRKVKLDFEQDGISKEWNNSQLCQLLSDRTKTEAFFEYLKKKFNGDLFPIDSNDLSSISESCYAIIIDLLSGNELGSGQISLFELYDFSIIPVEFISNVYELFIGQDQQEVQSAYYTPLFLVDYILAETVQKKFITQPKCVTCRVLDPACGSGIFLVETLRKIIEQYQAKNPNYFDDPLVYKEKLKVLASENIFGIDKDKSAINVAIFSIYLTLLDYQKPSDIETFKFPLLFNKNFFSNDFFDLEADFNHQLKNVNFDFVLGNPPWRRGRGEKNPLYVNYIKKRKSSEGKSEISIDISNREIAQAFLFRVSDFSTHTTKFSMIVTSKVLYNLNAKKFRSYLLHKFSINKVLELAPVRKEVFDKSNDKAIAPATVLFYQFSEGCNTDSNTLEHITIKPSYFFSLFKVFTIQRNDYKKVTQKQLKDFDFLWKVLVYGNYLDFNLISRLKENYSSIKEIIKIKNFKIGRGITIAKKDQFDNVTDLIGKPYLNSRNDIKQFWINKDPLEKWNKSVVHRSRSKSRELFKAPMLLITKGINKEFKSVSAVSEKDAVFSDTLTSINGRDEKDLITLQIISGLFNSSLFAYFNLLTFSSSGIEREQSHNVEKLSVPFSESFSISTIVTELSELIQKRYDSYSLSSFYLENDIQIKNNKLDDEIAKSFSLSSQEMALVEYSTTITIPMLMKHEGYQRIFKPLNFDDSFIDDYINLFFSRFNKIYKKVGKQLIVDVHYSNQIICLFFKLVPHESDINQIHKKQFKNLEILESLMSLSIEKITDRLFIQKDIRGFEKDGFYLIKPNEGRLWHKAIGHLDVNDFADAILKAGKKDGINV